MPISKRKRKGVDFDTRNCVGKPVTFLIHKHRFYGRITREPYMQDGELVVDMSVAGWDRPLISTPLEGLEPTDEVPNYV